MKLKPFLRFIIPFIIGFVIFTSSDYTELTQRYGISHYDELIEEAMARGAVKSGIISFVIALFLTNRAKRKERERKENEKKGENVQDV